MPWAYIRFAMMRSGHVPLQEPLEPVIGLLEHGERREGDGPEVVLSELLAESGSVHHDHALLPDEVEQEVLVRPPRGAAELDAGEHVERPLGPPGGDAVDLVEPPVGEVRPLLQLPVEVYDVVLGALQGCPGGRLAGDVWAYPGAELLHKSLTHLVHEAVLIHEVHVSDPPARHQVDFGESVEYDAGDIVRELGCGEVRPLHDDLVVDLVGYQRDVVLCGDVAHLAYGPLVVHRAGRIVGIDDDHRLGAVGDPLPDHVGVEAPVLVLDLPVRDGAALVVVNVLGVGGVSWTRNKDLVAGLDQRPHHHVDGLADARGDIDVVRCYPRPVLLELPVDDGLTEIQVPLRVPVSVVGLVDRRSQRGLEIFGGLEVPFVGIADVEIKGPHPGLAGGGGRDGDLAYRVVHSHRPSGCLDLRSHNDRSAGFRRMAINLGGGAGSSRPGGLRHRMEGAVRPPSRIT